MSTDEIEGIAVIGMAGRFPGAEDLDTFWDNLCQAKNATSFYSDQELLERGVSPDLLRNPFYVKAGAPLEDIDLFDAAFFDIPPRQAQTMDPQMRVFLETAWHALEHAGYAGSPHKHAVGVFAGSSFSTYLLRLAENPELLKLVGIRQILEGNDKDNLPMVTAYKLNLRGPSVNVQSGCTTALSATHFACTSLMDYQCDMALAGAASINASGSIGYLYEPGGTSSPDGRCRAFDADANGHFRGDGAAVLVLKRMEDALEDNDNIIAVIKGSAINNDGAGKVGFSAPGMAGMTRSALAALEIAEVDPRTIGYLEAHGTGTPMGDPVELEALSNAFRKRTPDTRFCAVGSVKTNIGHLDATSGMASLIKAGLALQQKKIPASLGFETPNPRIDFESSPFFVNTALRDWAQGETPRRAGVNSYGIGGSNAFFVLEEAPTRETEPSSLPAHVLPVSARTPAALRSALDDLRRHLSQHPDVRLADVAFTLQVGRRDFPHRRSVVASSIAEAVSRLGDARESVTVDPSRDEITGEVCFVFGDRDDGLTNGFRALLPHHPELEQILPSGLSEPLHGHRAVFAAQYCLATWLMKLGIEPAALVARGASVLVAETLAGVYAPAEALRLLDEPEHRQAVPRREPRIPIVSEVESHQSLRVEIAFGDKEADQQIVLLRATDDPAHSLPAGLARLWSAGLDVGWSALYAHERRGRLPLPLYPFQRKRFWVASTGSPKPGQSAEAGSAPVQLFERPELSSDYVAPESETEKAVVTALQNHLGIDRIGVADNFFELGGSSMTAVFLAARLGHELRVTLSPTLFMTAATIRELAAEIASLEKTPASSVLQSPVVPLQPHGDRPPIYLVHPMGGGLFVYRDIARMIGPDQPLYGLQAADLTEIEDTSTGLEEMAAHYIRAIREHRPEGPRFIGGWSFGGFVAYEMACQLAREGKPADLLIILDTPAPNEIVTDLEDMDDLELLYSAGRDAARAKGLQGPVLTDEIRSLPTEEQLDRLMDFIHRHELLPRDTDNDWMMRLARGWKVRGTAVKQYRPKPYRGRTILFRAEKQDEEQLKYYPEAFRELRRRPLIGWDQLIPSADIEAHDIPGYHNTIGLGANAQLIVNHLRAAVSAETNTEVTS